MFVRRTLAALVGAALLLSGCGGDPEPRFEPTTSPSPSESETSAEPEAQTPEEFIRVWFAVGTEMQNTGETEAFLAMTSGCDACQSLADRVAEYYADGGFVRIARQEVTTIDARTRSDFSVMVDAAPTIYKASSSSPRKTLPGGLNEFRVFVRKVDGSWRVTSYADTPS